MVNGDRRKMMPDRPILHPCAFMMTGCTTASGAFKITLYVGRDRVVGITAR